MQPWFTVYFFDIGHPCYDQLTPVGIRWPVSRDHIAGSILQLIEVKWFFEVDRWPGAGFSIGSRAHVWLTCSKQGRIVRKPVNANPGLNVNQIITFSSFQKFYLLCFLYWWWLLKLKTECQKIYRLLNSNKNCTFSWVSLIGLWTTRPRSYAFRLA